MGEILSQTTIYDYKTITLEGAPFPLSQLKGKKVMIVNTASKCGFTPQYEELEKLYETYGGDKFIIIGFPSNDFLWQEPGTNTEIREFCTRNYGVSFPMMTKIKVTGSDMDPIYKWLTSKSLNGVMDSKVKWNFQKYLIDENGHLVKVLYSKTTPMSDEVVNWILGKE
jgi:glutathione peroxidase